MGMRVEDGGESERRLVMRRIEVAPNGNITSRESGQTSTGSFITREFEEPSNRGKQMTAKILLTGASLGNPNGSLDGFRRVL